MKLEIEKLPSVLSRTGLSRSTIYNLIKIANFPAPISLGSRSVGWISTEVDDWIQERIDASRGVNDINGGGSK